MLLAQDVLAEVLAQFDREIEFAVLRNYECLPARWENDVDILVSASDFSRARQVVRTLMLRSSAGASVLELRRYKFAGYKLQCADRLLQVDLYADLTKAWIRLADPAVVLGARRHLRESLWVPRQDHEVLLVAAKELLTYHHIREKYHGLLGITEGQITQRDVSGLLGSAFSSSGQEALLTALQGSSKSIRPRLRASAVLRLWRALHWFTLRWRGWRAL